MKVRRLGTVALTALLLACSADLAAPVQATTTPLTAAPSVAADGPLAQLEACLQQRKVGDVLFVIDRSSSLQDTDKYAARVTGAQLVLDQLLSESSDAKIKLTVALTGFDASLGTETDWTALTSTSVGALTARVASFSSQNMGVETDYWTALTEARAKLSQHAATAGTVKPCQTLLLFTDGRYQLQARNTPQLRSQYGLTKPIPGVQKVKILDAAAAAKVVGAGGIDICRTGGVADELRSDGVTLIAVGLQSDASDGTRDFSFLQRVTQNSQHNCGQQPVNGYLVQASDVNDLLFAFHAVADPLNPTGPVIVEGVCQVSQCPQQAHTFVLDASIKKINLLGAVNANGVNAYLKLPGHAAVLLPRASGVSQLVVGNTRLIVQHPDANSVSVDAAYGGVADWSGRWSLTFVDPTGDNPDAVSKTQLTISGDLQGVLAPPTTAARAGESSTLMLELTRQDGTPTDLGNPAPSVKVSVSAAAVGSTDPPQSVVDQQPMTSSTTQLNWAIPANFPGTQAQLRVVLSVRTVSGLALQDAVTQVSFPVAAPLGYPHLTASTVAFPRANGRTVVHATLQVAGPGCVWVDGSTMQAFPSGSGATSVTSPDGDSSHCLRLADHQNGLLPLILKPGAQGNGDLKGSLTVHLAPAGHPDRAQKVAVTFIGSQQRLPNPPIRWAVFAAAMIIGIGIPLLVLFWLRWQAARLPAFTPTSTIVDIELAENSLTMADDSPASNPAMWRDDPQITGSRRETTLSGLHIRARAGLRLQSAGYALLTGGAGVGSQPPHQATGEQLPVLPLQLRGGWAVIFDPTTRSRAKLLLVVGPQANSADMAQEMSEVFAAARRDAPQLVRAAGGAPQADAGPTGSSPFEATPGDTSSTNPFQSAQSSPWGSNSTEFGAPDTDPARPFGGQGLPAGDKPLGPLGAYPRDSR